LASILVSKAGFAPDSPDVERLKRMARQSSLPERFERMARAADEMGEECNQRSTILLRMNESGHVDMARIALVFHGLATILRAGTDSFDNLREENLR
jgi:hypothetical protein